MFGLRGFGYTRLRKIINVKTIVPFTTWNQLYTIFGCAQAKSYSYGKIVLFLRDSWFTRCFQERNPVYK